MPKGCLGRFRRDALGGGQQVTAKPKKCLLQNTGSGVVMRLLLTTVAIAVFAGQARAQSEAEVAALFAKPFEEAFLGIPERERDGLNVGIFRFMARRSLADLYYPIDLRKPLEPLTDPETVEVVRDFERKSGGTVDGSLSMTELGSLMRLAALSRLTSVSPGGGEVDVQAYGPPLSMITASGSWSMPDIAWPLNFSKIMCRPDSGTCEDASVTISAPSTGLQPSSGVGLDSYIVSTNTEYYEIQSWKDGILDAVTSSSCRRVRLTINTITKLVSQTVEDLDPNGCEIPGSNQRLDPINGVRVATLISPWTAQTTYRDQVQATVNAVAGPLREIMAGQDD